MTDKETAQRIWDLMTSEGRRSVEDIEKIVTASRTELARKMITEGDRFVDAVKGRQDERADGAFVAMTRLVRNLREIAKAEGIEL